MSTLKEKYYEEVRPALMQRFSYKNILEVPRLEKVVVNMGVGEGKENPKLLEAALRDLSLITGQRPVVTKARKSVASFKVREGMSIGCKVTLRGE
jgi:large subunit ribosomal protein L5